MCPHITSREAVKPHAVKVQVLCTCSLKIEYLGRVIFRRRRFGKKALEVLRLKELRPFTLHGAHGKVFKSL